MCKASKNTKTYSSINSVLAGNCEAGDSEATQESDFKESDYMTETSLDISQVNRIILAKGKKSSLSSLKLISTPRQMFSFYLHLSEYLVNIE